MVKVIKRNGKEKPFSFSKIKDAINRCCVQNQTSVNSADLEEFKKTFSEMNQETITVEEIQDLVVKFLSEHVNEDTADSYQKYREDHEKIRDAKYNKHFYDTIIELVNGIENDTSNENANKNPRENYVIRDLIAGETSKKFYRALALDPKIQKLHEKGLLHVHDLDYRLLTAMTNCSLPNVADMLLNGTVIQGKLISNIKSLRTAATVTTQINLAVSNSQYGGQTIDLSALTPFVERSRERCRELIKGTIPKEKEDVIIRRMMRQEVKDSIQILNYQWNSFTSTNGQSPFISVWMHVDPNKPEQFQKDTAMLIREMLRQRIIGMKSPTGNTINPTFPKLLYALDENNIKPGTPYYYLTKLAAKCTSMRMVPDFVSVKTMKKIKEGGIYPPMGCVDENEVITYKVDDELFVESIGRAWKRLAEKSPSVQPNGVDLYKDLDNVLIYDSNKGDFVKCHRIIRNQDYHNWVRIKTSNGRLLTCTEDHPLHVVGKGRTFVKDIEVGDEILGTWNTYQGGVVISVPLFDMFRESIQYKRSEEYISDDTRAILSGVLSCGEKTRRNFVTALSNEYAKQKGVVTTITFKQKELALIILQLVNSLGMYGCIDEVDDMFVVTYNRFGKLKRDVSFKVIEKVSLHTTNKYSYDVTTESDMFDVSGIISHNCRSMLTPYYDEEGNHKSFGRLNLGVISLNIPYIALESKDEEDFFTRLDKYTRMVCDEQIRICDRIAEEPTERAPILWNYGAVARLPKNSKIGDLIKTHKGYATVSVGYTGLAEAVYRFGIEYVSEEGKEFGMRIVNAINKVIMEYRANTMYDFSLYGTPSENTTTKFAKALKKFKKMKNVNDHTYVTNSCHVPVWHDIDCYSKINFEGDFAPHTSGGYITYIQAPDIRKNPESVVNIMKYIYDHALYCEINTTSCDVCYKCGYEGEITMHDDGSFECPQCHNTDKNSVYVCRRLCGYLGDVTNGISVGRRGDINDRVNHM